MMCAVKSFVPTYKPSPVNKSISVEQTHHPVVIRIIVMWYSKMYKVMCSIDTHKVHYDYIMVIHQLDIALNLADLYSTCE